MSRSQHNIKAKRKAILSDASAPSALRRAIAIRGNSGAGTHQDQMVKHDHAAARKIDWNDPANWDDA